MINIDLSGEEKSEYLLQAHFENFSKCYSTELIEEVWSKKKSWIIDTLAKNGILVPLLKASLPSNVKKFKIQQGSYQIPTPIKKKIFDDFGNNIAFRNSASLLGVFLGYFMYQTQVPDWMKVLYLPFGLTSLKQNIPVYISDVDFIEALSDDKKIKQLLSINYYSYIQILRNIQVVHDTIIPYFYLTVKHYQPPILDEKFLKFDKYYENITLSNHCFTEVFDILSSIKNTIELLLENFQGKKFKNLRKIITDALFDGKNMEFFPEHNDRYMAALAILQEEVRGLSPKMTVDILNKILDRVEPKLLDSDREHLVLEIERVEKDEIKEDQSVFCSLLLPSLQGNKQVSYADFEQFGQLPYSFACIKNFCENIYHLKESIPQKEVNPEEEKTEEKTAEKKDKQRVKKRKKSIEYNGQINFPYLPENPRIVPFDGDSIEECYEDILLNGKYFKAHFFALNNPEVINTNISEAISLGIYYHPIFDKAFFRLNSIAEKIANQDLTNKEALFCAIAYLRPVLFSPNKAYIPMWAQLVAKLPDMPWVSMLTEHLQEGKAVSYLNELERNIQKRTLNMVSENAFAQIPKSQKAEKFLNTLFNRNGFFGKYLLAVANGDNTNLSNIMKFADPEICRSYVLGQKQLNNGKILKNILADLMMTLYSAGLLACNWKLVLDQKETSGLSIEDFYNSVNTLIDNDSLEAILLSEVFTYERRPISDPISILNFLPLYVKGTDVTTGKIRNYKSFLYDDTHIFEEHLRRGHHKEMSQFISQNGVYTFTEFEFLSEHMLFDEAVKKTEIAWNNLYLTRRKKYLSELTRVFLSTPEKRVETIKLLFDTEKSKEIHDDAEKALREYIRSCEPSGTINQDDEFWFALEKQDKSAIANLLKTFGMSSVVIEPGEEKTGKDETKILTFTVYPSEGNDFALSEFLLVLLYGTNTTFIKKNINYLPATTILVLDFTKTDIPEPLWHRTNPTLYFSLNEFQKYRKI